MRIPTVLALLSITGAALARDQGRRTPDTRPDAAVAGDEGRYRRLTIDRRGLRNFVVHEGREFQTLDPKSLVIR